MKWTVRARKTGCTVGHVSMAVEPGKPWLFCYRMPPVPMVVEDTRPDTPLDLKTIAVKICWPEREMWVEQAGEAFAIPGFKPL